MHLIKLAVGVRDLAHLAAIQARRAAEAPPLRHQTRARPRRAAEIIAGGSLYWVIQGAVLARQRVIDIIEDRWDDATACAGLVLDPMLVRVAPRPVKPFQGWRYLAPEAAPADLPRPQAGPEAGLEAGPAAELPEALRRALAELALL